MQERRRINIELAQRQLSPFALTGLGIAMLLHLGTTIYLPIQHAVYMAMAAYAVALFALCAKLAFANRRLVILLFIINLACTLTMMAGVSLKFFSIPMDWPTWAIVVFSEIQWVTLLAVIVATNNRTRKVQRQTFIPIAIVFISIGVLRVVDASALSLQQIRVLNSIQEFG